MCNLEIKDFRITMCKMCYFKLTLICLMCVVESILEAEFAKTEVKFDNSAVVKPPIFRFEVKSALECSTLCSNNNECRKYMLMEDNNASSVICSGYSDGTYCVALIGEKTEGLSCYRKLKQTNGGNCTSPVGYYGPDCEHVITDCADGKNRHMNGVSLSFVKPADSVFEVQCDFDSGSTVIQARRSDVEEVNFTRPWVDYIGGFGYTFSEHWIGLKNMYNLTNQDGVRFMLNIRIWRVGHDECINKYYEFKLLSDFDVTYNGYDFGCRTPPNSAYLSSTTFSTYDAHRNTHSIPNADCNLPDGGGWWFRDTAQDSYCTFSNLNDVRENLKWYDLKIEALVMQLDPY